MARKTVLVVDRNPKFLEKTREILEEVDYRMVEAASGEEARDKLIKERPEVVLANVVLGPMSGFDLCRHVKSTFDEAVPVVLMLANDDAETTARVFAAGAENYLVRPLKRSELLYAIRDLVLLRSLLLERKRWREAVAGARVGTADSAGNGLSTLGDGGVEAATQFYQFEFFKKLITIELKRAQRYAFPLSLVMVSLDDREALHGPDGAALGRQLLAGLAQAIRKSIRDIDVPVTFNDGNVLVVMPHTDLEGALVVAKRIHSRVRKSAHRSGAVEIRPTVSVGATSSRGIDKLTFPVLMQKVNQALREARRAGGDSVVSA